MGEASRKKRLREQGLLPEPTPRKFQIPQNMSGKTDYLFRLSGLLVPELERTGRQHSCIFVGAVVTKLLHRHGLQDAFPLTVRPKILNPAGALFVRKFGLPQTPEQNVEWNKSGCATIFVGHGPGAISTNLHWAGHLVVVLPNFFEDRPAIWDVTITQVNKNDWGIEFLPLFARATDTFLSGEDELNFDVNSCLISYKAFPDDHSYSTAPDWTNSADQDQLVERILKLL